MSERTLPHGWQAVPSIGVVVKADYPLTSFNPTETFRVCDVKIMNGRIHVRGLETCWFELSMITNAEEA